MKALTLTEAQDRLKDLTPRQHKILQHMCDVMDMLVRASIHDFGKWVKRGQGVGQAQPFSVDEMREVIPTFRKAGLLRCTTIKGTPHFSMGKAIRPIARRAGIALRVDMNEGTGYQLRDMDHMACEMYGVGDDDDGNPEPQEGYCLCMNNPTASCPCETIIPAVKS